ncbi:MAG: right-handed parallel beta-helix repeat-containing protein [Roseimicrobium sp.]
MRHSSLPVTFALAFTLFGAWGLRGADYYVAAAGDDTGPGTKEQPWRTISKAAATMRAGDTGHVLPGTYNEKVLLVQSGSEGKPITLQADGNVAISGKGIEGENIVHIKNASHIRVVGFEIRDNLKVRDGSGLRVEGACSHVELKGCRIHEIRGKDAMGITIYGSNAEQPISDILISDCEIFNCEPARSEALTLNGNVTNFRILNNIVRDVNNIGICMIGGESWLNGDPSKVTRNGLCKGNKVSRARANYGDGYAAGIYVDGGSNIVVEENEVTGCNLGIEVGAENQGTVTRDITVKNNRIYQNQKAGIVFGGYDSKTGRVRDCVFESNLCYHNDTHEDRNGELWIQWSNNNTVKSNIFWAGGEAMLMQSGLGAKANVIDGNIWYTEAGAEEANFTWLDHEITGFDAYRKLSGQDVGSVFSKPTITLPTAARGQ